MFCIIFVTKMETRYYKSDVQIPLNRDNWFYVMVDASIRTVFLKYDVSLPKYVIVEENGNNVKFTIFRSDVMGYDAAKKWKEKKIYILDELRIQAEANSFDDYEGDNSISYKFEIT